MKILTIRTDKEEAEISLITGDKVINEKKWLAHRELSNTILLSIEEVTSVHDIEGLVVFRGPGSFTGIRIGITVANTLAYSLDIPVVGANGKGWIDEGVKQLLAGKNDKIVAAEYGGEANITKPRK